MKLTLTQFDILTAIEREQSNKLNIKDISRITHLLENVVEDTVKELKDNDLIVDNEIFQLTSLGYESLEPYRVKHAIFMAAGFGSRMVPLTLKTPKPLVKVHGKRIIETLLDAVVDAGINDITIVRGYLGQQFDLLLEKYPMIKFVDNKLYNEANSISSAYAVRDRYQNSYVFDSDLVLYNPKIIRKYEYTSNYIGYKVDETDDWYFETTEDRYIKKMGVGGKNVFQMVGVSYWSAEDGKKMFNDIKKVFDAPKGKERYWDEVALDEYKDNYKVLVREVNKNDIIEIDTYEELKKIDSSYTD